MSALPADWRVDEPPPFRRLLDAEIGGPLLLAVGGWQLAALLVRRLLWTSFGGFRQRRLQNLSVCLLHSCVAGAWAGGFFARHPAVMFGDPVFFCRPGMCGLLLLTVGYFLHDAADMLRFERSRWTLELLAHHLATGFVLSCALCSRRFVVFAYWALLMEVNRRAATSGRSLQSPACSVFLHLRTIFLLSGARDRHPTAFRWIKAANLATFVVCRFLVQAWQLHFVVAWRAHFHAFYAAVGLLGGGFFLLANLLLFFRLLAADGLLGDFGRRHAAIQRDDGKADKRE
ncbi:TLC domain-containing protein 2 [Aphelenchoides fujianensis]|nr:TLC domain-containing protein 2 [Aphelenchoides fujianensis]